MPEQEKNSVNTAAISEMLERKEPEMKRILNYCVRCSICAESCFLYMAHKGDPQYMPSYKIVNSLGILYKKKGNVDRQFLRESRDWYGETVCFATAATAPSGSISRG